MRAAMGGADTAGDGAGRVARRVSLDSVMARLPYSGASWQCQPWSPILLAPLFAPLTSLRGIGPALAAAGRARRGRRSGDRPAVPPARSPTSTAAQRAARFARVPPGRVVDARGGGGAHRAAGQRPPAVPRRWSPTAPALPNWSSSRVPRDADCRSAREAAGVGKID